MHQHLPTWHQAPGTVSLQEAGSVVVVVVVVCDVVCCGKLLLY